jgi:hypothetical protein
MPYIKQERRADVAKNFGVADTAGELNFFITNYITGYYLPESPSYSDFNEVVGVLESVKLEFYRRMVAPYEDQKIKENGDVY